MHSTGKAAASAAGAPAGSAITEYGRLRRFMGSDPVLPLPSEVVWSVVYTDRWGKDAVEFVPGSPIGALGFAAPASYNQKKPVRIMRNGVEAATYHDGHFRSADKELTRALRGVVGDDEYTATINGRRTPLGGLHGCRPGACSCGR